MPGGGIRRADIVDTEIVDAIELGSDGTSALASSITISSTTSITKRVVCSSVDFVQDPETRLEPGDIAVLTGTIPDGDADGTYVVDAVIDATTFTTIEAIADSTGGIANFKYPAGAKKVGFDPTGLSHTAARNVQDAIADLDSEISAGGITAEQHKILRQLIHFIDNGPAEGFASGAYRETTPAGDPFPTAVIWYDKAGAGKKKIVEKVIVFNANKTPDTITWKIYDATETLLATITDTMSYSGVFETSRTRTIA